MDKGNIAIGAKQWGAAQHGRSRRPPAKRHVKHVGSPGAGSSQQRAIVHGRTETQRLASPASQGARCQPSVSCQAPRRQSWAARRWPATGARGRRWGPPAAPPCRPPAAAARSGCSPGQPAGRRAGVALSVRACVGDSGVGDEVESGGSGSQLTSASPGELPPNLSPPRTYFTQPTHLAPPPQTNTPNTHAHTTTALLPTMVPV